MSGFKALHDVSIKFGSELRLQSADLFCAKVYEDFEDNVAKKHQDISFMTSKLRFVQAKTLAALPQIKETDKNSDMVVNDYTETVTWKLIEQQLVKILTQDDAVKGLVTTPDRCLDSEQLQRKSKIIEQAAEFSEKELTLRRLNSVLQEKESQLVEARKEWDMIRGKLKNSHSIPRSEEQPIGPLHKKLQSLVDKMELMRWLISKLVISKSREYDWATDPHRRLKVLALTRQCHTIHSFTDA